MYMKEMFQLRATNTQNNIKSTLKKIVNVITFLT